MRLWHKDLIHCLPREQLVAQWRECSAIAGAILKNGTPNHVLVNYVLEYPIEHFIAYSKIIKSEMDRRGYKTQQQVYNKICGLSEKKSTDISYGEIFKYHHDEIYLKICLWNLYEKKIRGGLTMDEYSENLPFYLHKLGELSVEEKIKEVKYKIDELSKIDEKLNDLEDTLRSISQEYPKVLAGYKRELFYLQGLADSSEWIPCAEETPKDLKGYFEYYPRYIVTLSDSTVTIAYYREDLGWIIDEPSGESYEAQDGEVIAWRSFPMPFHFKEN